MELISRENVLSYLQRGINFWYDEDEKAHEALETMKSGIEAMPTIESRQKGKWIDHYYSARNEEGFWKCSNCGREVSLYNGTEEEVRERYPFCHCGADMRGEEEW